MVLGFVFFWPVGLALLAYMIWSGKIACKNKRMSRNLHVSHSTGNSAFDAYRADTLQRLEEEQKNFEAFLQRLRDAHDKVEFDQFMEERAKAAAAPKAGEETEKA